MDENRLVADVGGTNVRFAIASSTGKLERVQRYRVGDFALFEDALRTYLDALEDMPELGSCAVGAAGPKHRGVVKLTNNKWSIDRKQISENLNGIPVILVNDVEAVAAALPHLAVESFDPIGGPLPERPELRTMLALNIGTGFGAASVINRGGTWWTCPGEPGHMSLGAQDQTELEMLPENATVESVLSGNGILSLYKRHAERLGGSRQEIRGAADIFAWNSRNTAASIVVKMITKLLGRVAGDLVLAAGSWGGIYLSGSVSRGWSEVADHEAFRREFDRKGRMHCFIRRVPTVMIRCEHVSLHGLAVIAI